MLRSSLLEQAQCCHNKIFCISRSDVTPVDSIKAEFRLYTSAGGDTPQIVKAWGNSAWSKGDIPSNLKQGKTVFISHGWRGTEKNSPWMKQIRAALFQTNKAVNVFAVDWGNGSGPSAKESAYVISKLIRAVVKKLMSKTYSTPAKNTEVIGSLLAKYVDFLVTSGKITAKDVHCIGFSLGGQVCGWMGHYARTGGKKLIGRITGLDPAGPFFYQLPADKILDKSDAEFVDVIHTNTGVLGIDQDSGHMDFYLGAKKVCTWPKCLFGKGEKKIPLGQYQPHCYGFLHFQMHKGWPIDCVVC